MLHAAGTWDMEADILNRLQHNDHARILWICNVKAKGGVSPDSLIKKHGIKDWKVVLFTSRMKWFEHIEHSTCCIAEAEYGCT